MIYSYIPLTQNKPIGGVGALMEYIYSINQIAGISAGAVLSDSPYIKDWLESSFSDIDIYPTNHEAGEKDVIIIPEVCPDVAKNYPKAKKYLSVLNWKYYEDSLGRNDPAQLGYQHIVTNSLYGHNYLKHKNVTLPITIVSPIINQDLHSITKSFNDRPHNSIVILNRKNTHHIQPILNYLKDKIHQVTIVNNINPDSLADIFNNNQIFISLGYPEGFGLPAAEAMACGCIVVGFTGGGGTDFLFHKKNSFLAPDGDEKDLLHNLDYVLNELSFTEKRDISGRASNFILNKYSKINNFKQIYGLFKNDFQNPIVAQKKLGILVKKQTKPTKNKSKLNEKERLFDQLMKENNYLKYTLKTNKELLVNSRIYKIWRFYRNIIELKIFKVKKKFDF